MIRKYEPTDQNSNNTLRLIKTEIGLDPTAVTSLMKCQYDVSIAAFTDVVSFDYTNEGTAGTYTFPTAPTSVTTLRDALIVAFESIGYLLDDDARDIKITDNAGTYEIELTGELVIVQFTDSGATNYAATAKCNTKAVSDYIATFGALVAVPLTVNGVTSGTTYTATNDAAGAIALETALQGDALLATAQSVSVVYNTALNGLVVTIVNDLGQSIVLDGKTFTEENPQQIFVV